MFWDPGFSTIGTGSPIAEAFLVQRPYDETIRGMECLYRVYEAKLAAEKNKDVGPTTMIEIMPYGMKRHGPTDEQFELLDKLAVEHLHSIPNFETFTGALAVLDEDTPNNEPTEQTDGPKS